MASFVILLTARTARIACEDRHTHTHTNTTTTVTLSANPRRGLIMYCLLFMQNHNEDGEQSVRAALAKLSEDMQEQFRKLEE